MKTTAHIRRIVAGAMVTATALAIAVPVAGAADDGTLLGRAARQATVGSHQVMDDGTLLSRASRQAAQLNRPAGLSDGVTDGTLLSRASADATGQATDGTLLTEASRQTALRELAKINPGSVSDGMLLTKASLLYQLAQIDPGYGTGESIEPETTAARNAAQAGTGGSGFDWTDAAAGFGLATFIGMLGGASFVVRRRGTLIHLP